MIINRGKIIADGDIESIKQTGEGTNRINISLRDAEAAAVEAVLSSIEGVEGILLSLEQEQILKVKIECSSAVDLRADIYNKIKETDWTLVEFYQETQSLENIFRSLTTEN